MWVQQIPIKSCGFYTNPLPGSLLHPSSFPKKLIHIIGHLISHHIVGCPGQLIAQCLYGNNAICLCHLALIESLSMGRKPLGKVCCLYICPREVAVAISSVIFILLLAIREPLSFHTPAIRGVVSYRGKASYISHLQHDGQCQDIANPRDTQ